MEKFSARTVWFTMDIREAGKWLLRTGVLLVVGAYIYYLIIFLSPESNLFAPR